MRRQRRPVRDRRADPRSSRCCGTDPRPAPGPWRCRWRPAGGAGRSRRAPAARGCGARLRRSPRRGGRSRGRRRGLRARARRCARRAPAGPWRGSPRSSRPCEGSAHGLHRERALPSGSSLPLLHTGVPRYRERARIGSSTADRHETVTVASRRRRGVSLDSRRLAGAPNPSARRARPRRNSMKRSRIALCLIAATWLAPAVAACRGGEGRRLDPRLSDRQRRRGQPQLDRLGHAQQPDDALGRSVPRQVPERAHPDRRQGLLDCAARADRRHRAGRSDEPRDEADRDRRLREEIRLRADGVQSRGRRPCRLREQGQPARKTHAAPGGRDLLEDAPLRRARGDRGLVADGNRWDVRGTPHQPLRPQFRVGYLRLLQGTRALRRRLPRRREGAAGLRLGGAGRHRRHLRRSATAASATRRRA